MTLLKSISEGAQTGVAYAQGSVVAFSFFCGWQASASMPHVDTNAIEPVDMCRVLLLLSAPYLLSPFIIAVSVVLGAVNGAAQGLSNETNETDETKTLSL